MTELDLSCEARDVNRVLARPRGGQQRIHQQTLQRILQRRFQRRVRVSPVPET